MADTLQKLKDLELKIGDRIYIYFKDDSPRELTSFWIFWKKYKTEDNSYEIRLQIRSISDDKKIIECAGNLLFELKNEERTTSAPTGFRLFTKELLFEYIKDSDVVITRAEQRIFDNRK